MGEELKTAVLKNNMDEVRRIISADKDSVLTKEDLSESLILACEKGHLKMIAYLLTVKGVDVNYREKKKRVCPLMAAIKKQQQEAAELIVKQPNVDIYSGNSFIVFTTTVHGQHYKFLVKTTRGCWLQLRQVVLRRGNPVHLSSPINGKMGVR